MHSARHARRPFSNPGLHHLSRLRTRLLLQVQESQRRPRVFHRYAHLHSLPSLEMGTRHAPRHQRRFGSERNWRRLDSYGGGIPYLLAMDQTELPLPKQPVRTLFLIAPLFLFFVLERIPSSKAKPREKRSVYLMNFALLLWSVAMSMIYGFVPWLVIQVAMMAVAGGCGIWLFYVQHQFEDTYWAQGKDWDYTSAAMEGSSYYNLPKIMQWFSGNIGFHHIHHLNPLIPNYNLERCHYSDPFFQQAPELSFFGSFKTIKFRLWDEVNGKMISFRELKRQLALQESQQAA